MNEQRIHSNEHRLRTAGSQEKRMREKWVVHSHGTPHRGALP